MITKIDINSLLTSIYWLDSKLANFLIYLFQKSLLIMKLPQFFAIANSRLKWGLYLTYENRLRISAEQHFERQALANKKIYFKQPISYIKMVIPCTPKINMVFSSRRVSLNPVRHPHLVNQPRRRWVAPRTRRTLYLPENWYCHTFRRSFSSGGFIFITVSCHLCSITTCRSLKVCWF